jgi:hypothetical protein
MGGKLEAKIKKVLEASNLALIITEWSINGTEPGGKSIILLAEVLWFYASSPMAHGSLSENPWGTG